MRQAGRHFLQIPGPSNVPDRILRAMSMPTMNHRSPEFATLGLRALEGIKTIFKTEHPVVIYPASGTGAWEAALVNTLSPGDQVLMYETGHFASLWREIATRLGLQPEFITGDWRGGVESARIAERLAADKEHRIRAVCVVHNETSTGSTSPIGEVRAAIDSVGHPALLMVDTISSLGSIDYRHDEWKVDVGVGGSQKGLMLPPGLSFNALSPKAIDASRTAGLARAFWDWGPMLASGKAGYFPYTPAINLLYGLVEAVDMMHDEGLDNIFARHSRHAEATRRAVRGWDLELLCQNPEHYSSVLTAVLMPEGHSADSFRRVIEERLDMSLGNGLSRVADKVFRIGHLGDFNDLMLAGTLSGIEMGLELAQVPHRKGGVQAALDYLVEPHN